MSLHKKVECIVRHGLIRLAFLRHQNQEVATLILVQKPPIKVAMIVMQPIFGILAVVTEAPARIRLLMASAGQVRVFAHMQNLLSLMTVVAVDYLYQERAAQISQGDLLIVTQPCKSF